MYFVPSKPERDARVNSQVLILPIFAAAALAVASQAVSAPQSSVAAKRYEISFQTSSDKLTSQTTSSELAAVIDLLVHQGPRRELTFVMTGAVSKACIEWPNCPERTLLMHRAGHIADALRSSWPAGVDRGALERLRWEAIPSNALERDRDRVRILLRINPGPIRDRCPARLELLDPNLPGAVEDPDRAQWIGASADQPVAISSSARLRVGRDSQGPQSFEVWLNAGGQSKQLQPRHDAELGEKIFVVEDSESPSWITLRHTEDAAMALREFVQREGVQSRIGENVAGFPSTVPSTPPPGPCAFGFERWSP
jgi:hypothetical protein